MLLFLFYTRALYSSADCEISHLSKSLYNKWLFHHLDSKLFCQQVYVYLIWSKYNLQTQTSTEQVATYSNRDIGDI